MAAIALLAALAAAEAVLRLAAAGELPTSGQAHDELVETNAPYNRWPHLPLSGSWFLNRNVYVVDGCDDPLESELDSIFVGGGIRWTDDNLKYLLGAVPLGGL